ncbi:MAG TPA: hypothetical protein VM925_10180 [Labilithrix sp.]|nr:hypothetical protein [Labilithrix sp.]
MSQVPPGISAPNDPYRGRNAGAAFTGLSSGTRWVYLALVVASVAGFCATVGLWTAAFIGAEHARPDQSLLTAGIIVLLVTVAFLYAHIFVGLYWVYTAWQWLPPEQRYSRHWRSWITPGHAALLLLVPYFHYYWMFVVNCGLCDALDRMRVTYPTSEAAPKNLAITAGVCQIVVPLPVGAIMWLVFMSKIERMTREMSHANLPAMPAHSV